MNVVGQGRRKIEIEILRLRFGKSHSSFNSSPTSFSVSFNDYRDPEIKDQMYSLGHISNLFEEAMKPCCALKNLALSKERSI